MTVKEIEVILKIIATSTNRRQMRLKIEAAFPTCKRHAIKIWREIEKGQQQCKNCNSI